MKSDIRTFVLPAGAAASKRPMVTTESNRNQLKFRFKTPHLFLLLRLVTPVNSFAAEPYCIAVGGGFGNGGTTLVARNFSLPGEGKCTPWTGYTKTPDTVILTTTGTSCLSSNSTALTVSVSSADPAYAPQPVSDYIQLSRGNSTEPFTGARHRCVRSSSKRRNGDLHQRSIESPGGARLTGHGTRAAIFQGIPRWEKQDKTGLAL